MEVAMKVLSGRVVSSLLGAVLVLAPAVSVPAEAQNSRSAALAKELTDLLQQRKLDSIAARHPGAADQFVAALFFPNQLLVVTAKTVAPAVVNEKLIRREFRDVYIDLNSASIPESRFMITDMGADGLQPKREQNQPFDSQDIAGKGLRFDGNWREDKMSEQDYMKAYGAADEAYIAALQALVAALKSQS
jgi:hypothetical protein